MAKPKTHEPLSPPTTVRFTKGSLRRIRTTCNKLYLAEADAIRYLVDIGLEHLERIDYNIAAAVVDKVVSLARNPAKAKKASGA